MGRSRGRLLTTTKNVVQVTCYGKWLVIHTVDPTNQAIGLAQNNHTGLNMVADTGNNLGVSFEAIMLMRSLHKVGALDSCHLDWWQGTGRKPEWFFKWQGGLNRLIDSAQLGVSCDFQIGAHNTIPNINPPEALAQLLRKFDEHKSK